MTQEGRTPGMDRTQRALMMTMLGVLGQVGCLTLVIVFAALFAGLWLDNQFQTRPLFVVILLLASVPLTIYLMIRVVLSFAPRIQRFAEEAIETGREEEPEGGEHPTVPS